MNIYFLVLIVVVAFLYSSVGHGGASGYLALMAFFSFSPDFMRPSALILNIFVSLVAFFQYYRGGYFRWNLFWPFALASIPAAYIGGMITVDADLYKRILGIILIFPIIRLLGLTLESDKPLKPCPLWAAFLFGGVIGFLSGMIGIGGGIILSPIILLLHWANMKQTAAVSALFIFVNSIAGLGGIFSAGFIISPQICLIVVLALAGGIAGSYYGARKFNVKLLRRILGVVLIIASIKLVIT